MNYLAHLFLAGDSAESLIGNLAGDFVKGPLHDRFPPAIAAGIAMHRQIDAFTDSHPEVAAFRRVLIPEIGHYARVVADVFFDHFLACDWNRYSSETLEAFLARAYALMDGHDLPGRLANVYPRMRDERWLLGYEHVDGVRMALRGISWRLSRHPQLEPAVHHLIDSRDVLHYHFSTFFPDVQRFATSLHTTAGRPA
jgi:acyl carrier protein phosphodiesterase